MRHPFSNVVVGVLLGIAFTLVLILVWGLAWWRLISPGLSPAL